MKKIKITQKQYKRLVLAYRVSIFLVIIAILTEFSLLLGKFTEFLLIFLPYFATKGWYKSQYHTNSLKKCFLLSVGIFAFAIATTLHKEFSISFSMLVGLLISFASYKASVVQSKLQQLDVITNRKFDVDNCTEIELRQRCKEIRLSKENTELAVEFFINKTKQSVLADKLCINEKSVQIRKKRLRKKLNNNN